MDRRIKIVLKNIKHCSKEKSSFPRSLHLQKEADRRWAKESLRKLRKRNSIIG